MLTCKKASLVFRHLFMILWYWITSMRHCLPLCCFTSECMFRLVSPLACTYYCLCPNSPRSLLSNLFKIMSTVPSAHFPMNICSVFLFSSSIVCLCKYECEPLLGLLLGYEWLILDILYHYTWRWSEPLHVLVWSSILVKCALSELCYKKINKR